MSADVSEGRADGADPAPKDNDRRQKWNPAKTGEQGIPLDMLFRGGPLDAPTATAATSAQAPTPGPSLLQFADTQARPAVDTAELQARNDRRAAAEGAGAVTGPVPVVTTTGPTPVTATGAHGRTTAKRAPQVDRSFAESMGRGPSGWWGVAVALLAVGGVLMALARGGVLVDGAWAAIPGGNEYGSMTTVLWVAGIGCALLFAFALAGLTTGREGQAIVLSFSGAYKGTVRRTGFRWVNPLLLRHRVDVRLRHWRSAPVSCSDSQGVSLNVVVLMVWRVRDTARAVFAVEEHESYLATAVEGSVNRLVSQLPCDVFAGPGPSLRDGEKLAEELTAAVAAEARAVGVEVYSIQVSHLDYAPEIVSAMRQQQLFALDTQLREAVVDNVVTTVDDTVSRLTERGMVQMDEAQRAAMIHDLTVAFYAARGAAPLLAKESPRAEADGVEERPKPGRAAARHQHRRGN
ncbi:SPFH domain-containing protein [Streptomyces fractus]|uniref:SPFH domain-containing protein n=1 Tax=Streptomyces fractus TaxID=641806 RepID=UPI003CF204B0